VATNQATLIRVLADPTRLTLVQRLAAGERSVGDLARGLTVTRPAVSQHLKILRDVGLVVDRKAGTRSFYRLDPAGLAAARQFFDDLWRRALDAFAAEAERSYHPRRPEPDQAQQHDQPAPPDHQEES
jgi:DNA-binding transcriptional ArsR family regulator